LNEKTFVLAIKNETDENKQTMIEFCQSPPFTIEHLLRTAFHIRNLKRSTIEQLVEHEEKSLHNNRYHSRNEEIDQQNSNTNTMTTINNNNNNNNTNVNKFNTNGNINARQSAALITPQYLTRIPKISILDHQQVDFRFDLCENN